MHRGGVVSLDGSPCLFDQVLHPASHLCKHIVDKSIILPNPVWNIPEHDLPAFLQVSRPLLLLGDHDDHIHVGF